LAKAAALARHSTVATLANLLPPARIIAVILTDTIPGARTTYFTVACRHNLKSREDYARLVSIDVEDW
jgi:hypothetical protein